jgi:hypothetical protein
MLDRTMAHVAQCEQPVRMGNLTSYFSVASYIVEPASRQANARLVKVAVFLPWLGDAAVGCA